MKKVSTQPAKELPFANWLANLLGQSQSDIKRILENENALHFFITWSLFEAKCFSGDMRSCDIERYSNTISTQSLLGSDFLTEAAGHFYDRYQNKNYLKNLSDRDVNLLNKLKTILAKSFDLIDEKDQLFLLVFVIYRFRNNMFHGDKTVQTWLQFSEPIRYCIKVMQLLVSHAEARLPTMTEARN